MQPKVAQLTASIFLLFSLSVAFLESFTYYGFLAKHTHIPSYAIYAISIIIVLILHKSLPQSHALSLLSRYTTAFIVASFIILNVIEALTFPNFIFANIHLNLLSYPILVFLVIGYYSLYEIVKNLQITEIIAKISLMLGLGLYLYLNVPKVITGVFVGISEIIANPNATYDEKMERSYGDFYLAMKMVQELTPEDAILAIPPQENPWLSEGNGALVRYFVYPRQLTHIETTEFDVTPTHYLIAMGSWNSDDLTKYYWPKEPIRSSRIWELRDREYIEYDRDYNPETDKWEWGLIEVAQ